MIFNRLASFFGLSSDVEFGDFHFQIGGDLGEIHVLEDLADRLGADQGSERILAVLVLRPQIIILGKELAILERRHARVEHDVGFEIENALEILQRHVEQKADARRQRFQEPDMRHGSGERNMAHPLAPHARQRHFDTAFFADDTLVLHPLVLAAQAFVILDRTEDARAEQAVAFGLERAIIDRLRLLDLAERPRQNFLGRSDRYLDLIESLRLNDRIEEIHDLLIHACLLKLGPALQSRGGPALPENRNAGHEPPRV